MTSLQNQPNDQIERGEHATAHRHLHSVGVEERALPRHNRGAEQFVLGCMLMSRQAVARAAEVLTASEFYLPSHQKIYDCILDLYGRGQPVDPVTVDAELQRRGQWDSAGGAYLITLAGLNVLPASIEHHAELIAEEADARSTVEFLVRAQQKIESDGTPAVVAAEAIEQLRTVAARGWVDPVPLNRPLTPFPVDALGPVVGPMVAAVAEALQVPVELPANMSLSLITTAIGNAVQVRVNQDWVESIPLCTCSVLGSGEGKSPVVRRLTAPLSEFEQELLEKYEATVTERRRERELIEAQVEDLRQKALKSPTETNKGAYRTAAKELDSLEPTPVPPRLWADGMTPEAMVRLLVEQGGAVGIISDEGQLFDDLAGRYTSGKANLAPVLQATSGARIRVTRSGAGTVTIEKPALSISICVQPGVLAALSKQEHNRDSGLLARFLYVVPESKLGSRPFERPAIPTNVSTAWSKVLKELAQVCRSKPEPRVLKLQPEAVAELKKLHDRVEPRLAKGADLARVRDWAAKLPGTVVRIAGALTLIGDRHATEIEARVLSSAVQLGEAYIDHALLAFSAMAKGGGVLDRAKELLEVLSDHELVRFTTREAQKMVRGRAWVAGVADVRQALELLEDYGHVRKVEPERQRGQAGRPSEQWELHPHHR